MDSRKVASEMAVEENLAGNYGGRGEDGGMWISYDGWLGTNQRLY